jgi:hypothetical protein
LGIDAAANEAATAPLLAKDSARDPAPRPTCPASHGHHARSTVGVPTSGALRLQSPDPTPPDPAPDAH